MRVLVVSDIQGNIEALRRAVAFCWVTLSISESVWGHEDVTRTDPAGPRGRHMER